MFNVRRINPDEDVSHLHTFDFTKLSAINTCPTWGLVRYGHHKTFSSSGRAMALEAGEACHQVFAAVRIVDLYLFGGAIYPDHKQKALIRMREMFDEERADAFFHLLSTTEDERTRIMQACLYILETSGFYDDPNDKRRTLANLTESCIVYIDRHEFGKNLPFVSGTFIGIEQPFDLIVEYGTSAFDRTRKVRFTGKIDGVHLWRNNRDDLFVEENKTSSRLGDAWEESFRMSHQVTGYKVAAGLIANADISKARIRGLSIPQPRSYDSGGISNITVERNSDHVAMWADWFKHTCDMFFEHYDDPTEAPKYTHSCNRYFRPCSFIPLCAGGDAEYRRDALNEMIVDEWSPLHEKAGD